MIKKSGLQEYKALNRVFESSMEVYTQRAVSGNRARHVNHVTSKPDRFIVQLFEVLSALTHAFRHRTEIQMCGLHESMALR